MDVIFPYLENLIKQIPKGKVTTFKILAEHLGSPYSLKYILQNYKKINGWWRVVNEKGEVNDLIQKELLVREGIDFEGNKIKNLKEYIFKDFISEKILIKYRKIQEELREKIILKDGFKKLDKIAGVDLSYKGDRAKVVYVILDKNLNLISKYIFEVEVEFPYIPTFLAFREGEAILKTIDKVEEFDILFVNGQGIAHPVRMGLATYIGVVKNIPTIGITRKYLYGKIVDDKILDGDILGFVLKKFNKIVYVSPGNLISLETARDLSYRFWIKGNYPEPIRLADEISKKVRGDK